LWNEDEYDEDEYGSYDEEEDEYDDELESALAGALAGAGTGTGAGTHAKAGTKHKGTGYSGGSGGEDARVLAKNQAAVSEKEARFDEQLALALLSLTTSVVQGVQNECSNNIVLPALCSTTQAGSFHRALSKLLRNDSLMDVGKRSEVYRCLFDLVSALANDCFLVQFLRFRLDRGDAAGNSTTERLLMALLAQSRIFIQLQNSNEGGGDFSETLAIALHIASVGETVENGFQLAAFAGVSAPLPVSRSNSQIGSSGGTSSSASSSSSKMDGGDGPGKKKDEEVETRYVEALREMRFRTLDLQDLIAKGQITHVLQDKLDESCRGQKGAGAGLAPAKRMARVASEMASLATSLPVEFGSSVFLRCDESRMDLLKALIIAPDGTPYANGCFEFDIILPPEYPQVPPKVLIVTTGAGSVRFNPNLYNCGT